MRIHWTPKKPVKSLCRLILTIGLVGGCAGLTNNAWSERLIASERDALQVHLTQGVASAQAKHGDTFEAVLTDDHRYQTHQLPAGTRLFGQVSSARPSMIFGMPGYVVLDVQHLTLPSGQRIALDSQSSRRIVHPKANKFSKLIKSGIPFSALSVAESIPLKYAAGFSTLSIAPISLAARMALGVGLELYQKDDRQDMYQDKPHPNASRIGYGMLRGTGLPGLYYMLTPSPEPDLNAHASIDLHFDQPTLQRLFEAASTAPATDPLTTEPSSQATTSASSEAVDAPAAATLSPTDAPFTESAHP